MKKNSLRCIVIDDDPLITDLFHHYSSKLDIIEYCIVCNNPVDGLQLLTTQDFDLLFLDYNMPSLNGKSLLELKQDSSKVIMVTSNASFAVDSYDFPDIIDFLLKPVSFDRFYKSIDKFVNKSEELSTKLDSDVIFFKDGNKWIRVLKSKIQFIKSESNYVILYLPDKKVMSLKNLKDLECELPASFLRIHRSYIVNSSKIDYFSSDEVGIGDHVIPISVKYRDQIKELLN